MDLTDPVGPSMQLYTPETFALAKRAMAPGGALTLHIGSPISHPARVRGTIDNLRQVFSQVAPYFVHIPIYGSVWGFACASDTLDPRRIAPGQVEKVIAKRGIADLQYYNGEIHQAMFALPNYIRKLLA
jgi:spermidine synthase